MELILRSPEWIDGSASGQVLLGRGRDKRRFGVLWDAKKKSLDVGQKGVNLKALRGIKAL